MTDIRIPKASELRKNFTGDLVQLEPLKAAHGVNSKRRPRMETCSRGSLRTSPTPTHSATGSNDGFNWSSQRLIERGCDGQASWVDDGVDGPGADEVAGSPGVASGCRAVVLAGDRERCRKCGSRGRGGSVAGGWQPVVPGTWRNANVHAQAARRPVSVFEEREEIALLRARGHGIREIALVIDGKLRVFRPASHHVRFPLGNRWAAAVNRRPRKTLGWKTPAETLNEFLAAAG
jgi:hypothetical protein